MTIWRTVHVFITATFRDIRLASAFTPGRQVREYPKRSGNLVPWEGVPEQTKEIDPDLFRRMPTILAEAGYTILDVPSHMKASLG